MSSSASRTVNMNAKKNVETIHVKLGERKAKAAPIWMEEKLLFLMRWTFLTGWKKATAKKPDKWRILKWRFIPLDLFIFWQFWSKAMNYDYLDPRTTPKSCDWTGNFIHQKQMPYLIGTKRKSAADTRYRWFDISFGVHRKEIKKHFYEQISSKFFVFILFSIKNLFYSDHSAKCTSSQTENKQATQARQLLICTRTPSSFIWSA